MPAPDRKRRLTAFAVAMAVLIATPLAVVAADAFNDVPDSNVHHEDITWLRDAGVTFGCNPPANTEFCPGDPVLRQQMASFMRRLAENQVVEAATALEADHATTADSATTADNATTADSAGDANTLDGKDSSEFAENVWAAVNADGTLGRGAHVASTDSLVGTGTYEVIFDRDVSECSYVATVGLNDNSSSTPAGEISVNGRQDQPNGVWVQTFNSAGTAADRGFHLAVFCGATSVSGAASGGESLGSQND